MDITKWSILKSDWLHSLQLKMGKHYIVRKNKTGSWCGSDHKVLIAKFRIKLKKVGKSTKPLRYDLNQILYSYTVEVINRFKGLDLRTVPEELWTHVNRIVQEAVIKSILKENKMQRQMVVWESLTSSWQKKSERQRKQWKIYPPECRVWKNSKKPFLSDQRKEIEENNRMGKTRYLFKKIRDTKGTFHARWGQKSTEMVWT